MIDLDPVTAAAGVVVDPNGPHGFTHIATAWQVAPGEWLTNWADEEDPPAGLRLIIARSGSVAPISDWEADNGIAGFRSAEAPASLTVAGEEPGLHKRQPLVAVGYPCVIDHPAFALHRGSLSPERYVPYLCPWLIEGHLALFTADDGWLAGHCYHGCLGAPVCTADGQVVGLVTADDSAPGQVPLTRFRRLGAA